MSFMVEYAGVDPETGSKLYWKDIKDNEGNVTGQEKQQLLLLRI